MPGGYEYKVPTWASEEAKMHFHAGIIGDLEQAYLHLENVRRAEPYGWSDPLFEETILKIQETIELLMHHSATNMARTRPHQEPKNEEKEQENGGEEKEIAEKRMSDA